MDQVLNTPTDSIKSLLLLVVVVATVVGGLWQGFRWLRGQINEVVRAHIESIQVSVKNLIDDAVRGAIVSHEQVEQDWRNTMKTQEQEWRDDLKTQIVETNRRIDGMLTEVLALAREIIRGKRRLE